MSRSRFWRTVYAILFQAMRKALFKPGAFFKGMILPLCEVGEIFFIVRKSRNCTTVVMVIGHCFFNWSSAPLQEGTCTLREATLIASVIAKNSIRIYDSAATILQLAEMDYTGANSVFMKTLLDKKYGLPYQTVDAVVYHFLRWAVEQPLVDSLSRPKKCCFCLSLFTSWDYVANVKIIFIYHMFAYVCLGQVHEWQANFAGSMASMPADVRPAVQGEHVSRAEGVSPRTASRPRSPADHAGGTAGIAEL